ncbi:MAG TPA: hypothetical protein VHM30_15795, partial [Gemmatimonadaceae bacterium]|nr:hypothetical protein [Gemmatimonadaceae bacterium]
TYLRAPYATAFQNYDQPLGSELGPDADMVRAAAEAWPAAGIRAGFGAGLWRQGAQRLYARPGATVNGTASLPYPSVNAARPLVQRALIADGHAGYYSPQLQLVARVEVARVSNPDNQSAAAASYVRAQLIGRYAIRIP